MSSLSTLKEILVQLGFTPHEVANGYEYMNQFLDMEADHGLLMRIQWHELKLVVTAIFRLAPNFPKLDDDAVINQLKEDLPVGSWQALPNQINTYRFRWECHDMATRRTTVIKHTLEVLSADLRVGCYCITLGSGRRLRTREYKGRQLEFGYQPARESLDYKDCVSQEEWEDILRKCGIEV